MDGAVAFGRVGESASDAHMGVSVFTDPMFTKGDATGDPATIEFGSADGVQSQAMEDVDGNSHLTRGSRGSCPNETRGLRGLGYSVHFLEVGERSVDGCHDVHGRFNKISGVVCDPRGGSRQSVCPTYSPGSIGEEGIPVVGGVALGVVKVDVTAAWSGGEA